MSIDGVANGGLSVHALEVDLDRRTHHFSLRDVAMPFLYLTNTSGGLMHVNFIFKINLIVILAALAHGAAATRQAHHLT